MLLLIEIGEQIAKRRKTVGLTQAELAKMACVSRSTLDALENGRTGGLGYTKISKVKVALDLEFTIQAAGRRRPTLDDLMIENEREDAKSRRSTRS